MLFRRDIEPRCIYCLNSTAIGRGEVVCRNRGIMSQHGHCGAFIYEPTKRVPEYAAGLNTGKLSEEAFKL